MSIEATMVLMDNSEYARNGDLFPNRWEAQMEAIQLVANAKLEINRENGVGLILTGGKQVQLLMTPTNDQNQLMATFENIRLKGSMKFSVGLYIAQLTLKHRVNKKQAQRIIAFVSSPVEEEEAALINLAKKLKKNNIAVDVINFGEQREDHIAKLEKFVENVKKGNNSIFVNLKPGVGSVFDSIATAISNQASLQQFESVPQEGGQAAQQQAVPATNFQEYGGIDPNMDPELAMAMKLSLEEEKNRAVNQPEGSQQNQNQNQQGEQQQQGQQQQQAQEQAFQENQNQAQEQQQQGQNLDDANIIEEEEEDELMKQAKLLSMQDEEKAIEEEQPQKQEDQNQESEFQDKEFLQDLFKSVNVDPNGDEIKKYIEKSTQEKKEEEKKEDKDKKDDNDN